MPLPKNQREQLKRDLAGHNKEKTRLSKKAKLIDDEVRAHETIIAVGSDAQLQAVLDELYDKPQLASEMAKNPGAYLKKKGVKIPKNTTSVAVTKSGPDSTAVEGIFEQGHLKYKLAWDRSQGFSVAPIQ